MDVTLPLIWVSWAPLKVVFFLANPSRKVVKHGVLLDLVSASCGFYDEFLELVFHFFLLPVRWWLCCGIGILGGLSKLQTSMGIFTHSLWFSHRWEVLPVLEEG